MKAVSVINFKGGVGKTTLALHLACHLAGSAKVLLIDVDHQSSLSLIVLTDDLWKNAVAGSATINRLFESYGNRKVTVPKDDIILRKPFFVRKPSYTDYDNLDLVPAQFELDDTEIDLASTFIGNPTISDWEKRTLIASWLDEIDADKNYDYVVFDCPPATKIVSQNALAASHGYIVPVIPDDISTRGVTHFRNLVQKKIDGKLAYLREAARIAAPPRCYVEGTKLVAIAPFLVKPAGAAVSGMVNIHTEQLGSLRKAWKTDVLKTVGKNYVAVPEAVTAGWPVWDHGGGGSYNKAVAMMADICTDLKTRIDAL